MIDDASNALTDHLKGLEALKVGEWYYFNPCIYDCGGNLIKIEAVNHTDTLLDFSYRTIDTPPEAAPTQYVIERKDIDEDGAIFGMYLRPVYETVLLGFLINAVRNIGIEVLEKLKEQCSG